VNVSENAKENELEVLSDMTSIAADLLAEFDYEAYSDWKITGGGTIELVVERFDDLIAGGSIDFTVVVPYDKNICAVPTNDFDAVINQPDMKLVYDGVYNTTGSEGSALSIPEIVGKKLLLLIREGVAQHKVSSAPASAEYTWNNTVITLGTPVNPEQSERFLYLYRNY
jgi:hypothetical protein